MNKSFKSVYVILFDKYGIVKTPLTHETKFQLLIKVILSAQCTDRMVNKIGKVLFDYYPDPKSLAAADIKEIEKLIKPLGFYRNKAKNIKKTSEMLLDNYNLRIPDKISELTKLPGIGRKTANVILANIHEKPGFAVDTHVIRLLNRIGLVSTEVPEKIEYEVKKNLEPNLWGNFSLLLIMHGRNCCKAKNPECSNCILNQICDKNIKYLSK